MAYQYKYTVTFPYDKYDEVFKLLEQETNPADTRVDVAYGIEPNGDAKLDIWSRVEVIEIIHKCKEQFPAYKDDKERGEIVETFEKDQDMKHFLSHPLFEQFLSTMKHTRKHTRK
jgi:hypothetical protein